MVEIVARLVETPQQQSRRSRSRAGERPAGRREEIGARASGPYRRRHWCRRGAVAWLAMNGSYFLPRSPREGDVRPRLHERDVGGIVGWFGPCILATIEPMAGYVSAVAVDPRLGLEVGGLKHLVRLVVAVRGSRPSG